MLSTAALAGGLLRVDAFAVADVGLSTLAVVPAVAGMLAGQAIRERTSAKAFHTAFFAGLLALGAYLSLRTIV